MNWWLWLYLVSFLTLNANMHFAASEMVHNAGCDPDATNCTVSCTECGPEIHCPSTSDCDTCQINCNDGGSCINTTIFSYSCENVMIKCQGASAAPVATDATIIAPDRYGTLTLNALSGSACFSGTHIVASNQTGSIAINCNGTQHGNECNDMIIDASHATTLEFTCSDGASCDGTQIYCPRAEWNTSCLIDCDATGASSTSGDCSNMIVYAQEGLSYDVTWHCDNADNTSCGSSSIFCEYSDHSSNNIDDASTRCDWSFNSKTREWSCQGVCDRSGHVSVSSKAPFDTTSNLSSFSFNSTLFASESTVSTESANLTSLGYHGVSTLSDDTTFILIIVGLGGACVALFTCLSILLYHQMCNSRKHEKTLKSPTTLDQVASNSTTTNNNAPAVGTDPTDANNNTNNATNPNSNVSNTNITNRTSITNISNISNKTNESDDINFAEPRGRSRTRYGTHGTHSTYVTNIAADTDAGASINIGARGRSKSDYYPRSRSGVITKNTDKNDINLDCTLQGSSSINILSINQLDLAFGGNASDLSSDADTNKSDVLGFDSMDSERIRRMYGSKTGSKYGMARYAPHARHGRNGLAAQHRTNRARARRQARTRRRTETIGSRVPNVRSSRGTRGSRGTTNSAQSVRSVRIINKPAGADEMDQMHEMRQNGAKPALTLPPARSLSPGLTREDVENRLARRSVTKSKKTSLTDEDIAVDLNADDINLAFGGSEHARGGADSLSVVGADFVAKRDGRYGNYYQQVSSNSNITAEINRGGSIELESGVKEKSVGNAIEPISEGNDGIMEANLETGENEINYGMESQMDNELFERNLNELIVQTSEKDGQESAMIVYD